MAVDIQEYARVIASARLYPIALPAASRSAFFKEARRAEAEALAGPLGALVQHETLSLVAAAAGDPRGLCAVVEDGSLLAFEHGQVPSDARLALLLSSAAETKLPSQLVMTRYYGGVYFSYRQAIHLDSLLSGLHVLPASLRDVALASALGAASDAVTSVGSHFAQPIRPRRADGTPKEKALAAVARTRRLDVMALFAGYLESYARLPTGSTTRRAAVRSDFGDFLESYPGSFSALYADPPYTRDHYSRFYHVLETLALGDAPEISMSNLGGGDQLSRGLYRSVRHQSPFCIKSQAPDAFARLFRGARTFDAPLVVSYSPYSAGSTDRPRLMSIDDIAVVARSHYERVDVVTAGRLAHSKFNAADRNSSVNYEAEVFIVCEP